jgi:hypothetical protein
MGRDANDTIRFLGPTTGTGERYAVAMGELWSGLARTLARLDVIAGEPTVLEEDAAAIALRRLQYALHLASERVYGLSPPPGAETAHAELADALACARDATGEIAEAASLWGADGVEPLLHEWRGALFRVRLARLRLASPVPKPFLEPGENATGIAGPLVAFLLALFGAVAFVAGATLGLWPVWALGMLAVGGSVLTYRP